jgi:hypothetical protein
MAFAGGASAASRNIVNKIAAFFGLPKYHTKYPSDDVDFMLGLARDKARADAGLEEDEAERLRTEKTSLRQENSRLRHEKRLSDQSAESSFSENEKLRAENNELRIMVRALGGAPPEPTH